MTVSPTARQVYRADGPTIYRAMECATHSGTHTQQQVGETVAPAASDGGASGRVLAYMAASEMADADPALWLVLHTADREREERELKEAADMVPGQRVARARVELTLKPARKRRKRSSGCGATALLQQQQQQQSQPAIAKLGNPWVKTAVVVQGAVAAVPPPASVASDEELVVKAVVVSPPDALSKADRELARKAERQQNFAEEGNRRLPVATMSTGGDGGTRTIAKCEDCQLTSKNYGLPDSGARWKARWCGKCAKKYGGVLRATAAKLQQQEALDLQVVEGVVRQLIRCTEQEPADAGRRAGAGRIRKASSRFLQQFSC